MSDNSRTYYDNLMQDMYGTPEAQVEWRKITRNPNCSLYDLEQWYELFWNKHTDNLKKLLIPQLIESLAARQAKAKNMTQEEYNEWARQDIELKKTNFVKENPDYLKEGQKRENNHATFSPAYPKAEEPLEANIKKSSSTAQDDEIKVIQKEISTSKHQDSYKVNNIKDGDKLSEKESKDSISNLDFENVSSHSSEFSSKGGYEKITK